jgi:hypothetical protein
MITSYIAAHFDRIHDWLAVALVRYAERRLAHD